MWKAAPGIHKTWVRFENNCSVEDAEWHCQRLSCRKKKKRRRWRSRKRMTNRPQHRTSTSFTCQVFPREKTALTTYFWTFMAFPHIFHWVSFTILSSLYTMFSPFRYREPPVFHMGVSPQKEKRKAMTQHRCCDNTFFHTAVSTEVQWFNTQIVQLRLIPPNLTLMIAWVDWFSRHRRRKKQLKQSGFIVLRFTTKGCSFYVSGIGSKTDTVTHTPPTCPRTSIHYPTSPI